MPLLELLSVEVGGAIAKSILKLWAKDSDVCGNVSDSLGDVLKSLTSDKLTERKASRQFDEIGETVGKSLLPLFESEGARLDLGGQTAVAYAVAEAFNGSTVSAETLAR